MTIAVSSTWSLKSLCYGQWSHYHIAISVTKIPLEVTDKRLWHPAICWHKSVTGFLSWLELLFYCTRLKAVSAINIGYGEQTIFLRGLHLSFIITLHLKWYKVIFKSLPCFDHCIKFTFHWPLYKSWETMYFEFLCSKYIPTINFTIYWKFISILNQ